MEILLRKQLRSGQGQAFDGVLGRTYWGRGCLRARCPLHMLRAPGPGAGVLEHQAKFVRCLRGQIGAAEAPQSSDGGFEEGDGLAAPALRSHHAG